MKTYKLIIISAFLLMAFTAGDGKSEYLVPRAAYSILATDLDLDGDNDIVIGHIYNSTIDWGGFSFLQNESGGYFNLTDSLYTYDNQNIVYSVDILGDEIPEIIGRYWDGQQTNLTIVEINNGNFDISYYPMSNNLTDFMYGDISGNGTYDFAFISNNDFLWGVIYNDGTGNFSAPEYFDLDFPPIDISCADLNDDGTDDVVIGSDRVEVYFSTENGFEQHLLGYILPWSLGGHIISICDFDNDGDNDVLYYATHNSNQGVEYMYENLGNDQFYEHPYFDFSPFCSFAQTADFDNDSLPDIVFIAQDNSVLFIYHNMGDFQLEYDQFIQIENYGAYLRRITCDDLDGNGFKDIAGAIYSHAQKPANVFLLFNDGQGNFQDNPITEIQKPKPIKPNPLEIYPNPFKSFTNINFLVKVKSRVKITVLDFSGKTIKQLTNKIFTPGKHKSKWNGTDNYGKEVNNGTYLIRLETAGHVQTQRAILIK